MMYTNNKSSDIQTLFSRIAHRYDLLNTLLSLGWHHHWNHRFVQQLLSYPLHRGVDLCAGTGAVARLLSDLLPSLEITLVDFSLPMLTQAQYRSPAHPFSYYHADVHNLPFSSASMDFATMAYGIRNLADPPSAIHEVYRILTPGGIFALLELTPPTRPWIARCYSYYLHLLPYIGGFISGDREAYHYLAKSIQAFRIETVLRYCCQQGFRIVKHFTLQWGLVSLVVLQK